MQFPTVMLVLFLFVEAAVAAASSGLNTDSIILNSFQQGGGEIATSGKSFLHPNNELTKEGKKLMYDVGFYIYKRSQGGVKAEDGEKAKLEEDTIPAQVRLGRSKREVKATGSDFGAVLWETLTHSSWMYLLAGVSITCLIIAVVVLLCTRKQKEYTRIN